MFLKPVMNATAVPTSAIGSHGTPSQVQPASGNSSVGTVAVATKIAVSRRVQNITSIRE